MTIVNQDIAASIASQCKSYVETTLGEMAFEYTRSDAKDYFPEAYKKVAKARDWQGALADELYNDEDMIKDLAGDKIFDLLSRNALPSDDATYNAYAKVVAGYFTHLPGLDLTY